MIAAVNLEFLFSGMFFPYSCEVFYHDSILKNCKFPLYMEPDTIKLHNREINIISFDCVTTESESIPNMWYYDIDEHSLIDITGQSVQILNRMKRWISVFDNYVILLCGKENEDGFELFGIGRIIIDSSYHSNMSVSGEWIGFNRVIKKSHRTHSYNITIISKTFSFFSSQLNYSSGVFTEISVTPWDMKVSVNEGSSRYFGMLWYMQILFIIVFIKLFIYIVYYLNKYCQKRS